MASRCGCSLGVWPRWDNRRRATHAAAALAVLTVLGGLAVLREEVGQPIAADRDAEVRMASGGRHKTEQAEGSHGPRLEHHHGARDPVRSECLSNRGLWLCWRSQDTPLCRCEDAAWQAGAAGSVCGVLELWSIGVWLERGALQPLSLPSPLRFPSSDFATQQLFGCDGTSQRELILLMSEREGANEGAGMFGASSCRKAGGRGEE
mmetsp:Transcript_16806/g.49458  ORF Transcript_16806/g.49458 Transcript_16806/m.49458 type:complete len:206 (-) Transcript_16806:8-625(-)